MFFFLMINLKCLLENKFQQKHGQLSCLGSMDDSSRVGNITSSSSISTSDSRDSSRSQTSDVHRGRGRDTGIARSMVSQASISKSGVSQTMVSKTSISKAVSVSTKVVRIGLSADGSSQTEDGKTVHVCIV